MKMFDADKTMIGLPYSEKIYDNMLSRFRLIPERNGQTDGQTDGFAISVSRVSMLTCDKNLAGASNNGKVSFKLLDCSHSSHMFLTVLILIKIHCPPRNLLSRLLLHSAFKKEMMCIISACAAATYK